MIHLRLLIIIEEEILGPEEVVYIPLLQFNSRRRHGTRENWFLDKVDLIYCQLQEFRMIQNPLYNITTWVYRLSILTYVLDMIG